MIDFSVDLVCHHLSFRTTIFTVDDAIMAAPVLPDPLFHATFVILSIPSSFHFISIHSMLFCPSMCVISWPFIIPTPGPCCTWSAPCDPIPAPDQSPTRSRFGVRNAMFCGGFDPQCCGLLPDGRLRCQTMACYHIPKQAGHMPVCSIACVTIVRWS